MARLILCLSVTGRMTERAVSHLAGIGGIGLAVGGTPQSIALYGELVALVGDVGVEHAVAVGATSECHLAVGLDVFAIIDVYDTFRAVYSFGHRGVAANLDLVYLAGFDVGEE